MGTILTVLTIVVSVVIVAAIVLLGRLHGRQTALEQQLKTQSGFTPSQVLVGVDGDTALAVDTAQGVVCLAKNTPSGARSRLIQPDALIAVEVFEDGETVTTTRRSSQLGGALAGGLALGGVGAIVGALGAKTQSRQRVRQVALRLTVDDADDPLHDVQLLAGEDEKSGGFYRLAMEQARHWHGLISVLIRRTDAERQGSKRRPLATVADELKKLASLREAGALTAEEFESQKGRLLQG